MKDLKKVRKELKNLNGEYFKCIYQRSTGVIWVEIGYQQAKANELKATDERIRLADEYFKSNDISYDITILVDGFMYFRFFEDQVLV